MAILEDLMSEQRSKHRSAAAPVKGELVAFKPESNQSPDDSPDEFTGESTDESIDDEAELLSGPAESELGEEPAAGELDLVGPAEESDDSEPLVAPTEALEVASRRSLQRLDPLTVYINDIKRYPLLSREEEHELAVKFLESGDLDIARRLVTANLRLVVKIAHEYHRAHRNLLDLIQEGNVGLVQAVKKYDPYRGVKLSSYAAWWIRAYILKFILSNWRLVKIGTTQAQRKLFFNLRKEKEKLEKLGFEASPQALAEALSVPEREVVDMEKRLLSSDLSLDAPLSRDEGGGRSHLDLLASAEGGRPDEQAEGSEFRQLLREKFAEFEKTLRGREQTIFHERLMNEQPKTLQEIGDHYSISRERARQLEKRLLDKLKLFLQEELGDAVQIAMGLES
jgi:RNA polymerase sigma-32 factor